jgi:hypothetical protein
MCAYCVGICALEKSMEKVCEDFIPNCQACHTQAFVEWFENKFCKNCGLPTKEVDENGFPEGYCYGINDDSRLCIEFSPAARELNQCLKERQQP